MKYRLTITQTTTKQYGDDTYDDNQSVVYESDILGDVLYLIQASESVKPVRFSYKLEKVVEE